MFVEFSAEQRLLVKIQRFEAPRSVLLKKTIFLADLYSEIPFRSAFLLFLILSNFQFIIA